MNNISASSSGIIEADEVSVSLVVAGVVVLILIELVGNGLLASIMLYEKYGQDSKKRTLVNILMFNTCRMCIIYNIFSLPVLVAAISGLYKGPFVGSYSIYLTASFYTYSLLTLDEIAIFRLFYITNSSRMLALDDDFIGHFLVGVNTLASFLLIAIRHFSGEFTTNRHYCQLSGLKCQTKSELVLQVFHFTATMPLVCSVLVIIVSNSIIQMLKYQRRNLVANLSNAGKNVNLVGSTESIALMGIFLLILLPFGISARLFAYIPPQIYFLLNTVPSVVLPLLFYIRNPISARPAKECLKQFVDDVWFQFQTL